MVREERKKRRRRKYRVWSGPQRFRAKLSNEAHAAMLEAQGGRCWICGCELSDDALVDRSPQGAVRGLLCELCNRGLGLFDDDPRSLVNAARYVEHFRTLQPEDEATPAPVQHQPTGTEVLDDVRRNPDVYVRFSPEVQKEVDAAVREAFRLGPNDALPPPRPARQLSPRAHRREPAVFTTSWGETIDLHDVRLVERMKNEPRLQQEVDAHVARQTGLQPKQDESGPSIPNASPPRGRMSADEEFERRLAEVNEERDRKR